MRKCLVIPIWILRKASPFSRRFLKEGGILDELKNAGIQEGDTVRMYGFEFDYYK